MAKLKDLLSEDITTMGGLVSKPAFSNIDMGYKSTQLTDIVEDVYGQSTQNLPKQQNSTLFKKQKIGLIRLRLIVI